MVGGATLLPLPPGHQDLEVGWHVQPGLWECGYASEAMFALARWAFEHEGDELFAVVQPDNVRAAETVRDNGMEWVGETDEYFGRPWCSTGSGQRTSTVQRGLRTCRPASGRSRSCSPVDGVFPFSGSGGVGLLLAD